jgi:hypothetical protein
VGFSHPTVAGGGGAQTAEGAGGRGAARARAGGERLGRKLPAGKFVVFVLGITALGAEMKGSSTSNHFFEVLWA